MVAGYETSSILMSFFFYAMATEPAIQERVYEEIQREIGDVRERVSRERDTKMGLLSSLRKK